jgi:hypothetical protein
LQSKQAKIDFISPRLRAEARTIWKPAEAGYQEHEAETPPAEAGGNHTAG